MEPDTTLGSMFLVFVPTFAQKRSPFQRRSLLWRNAAKQRNSRKLRQPQVNVQMLPLAAAATAFELEQRFFIDETQADAYHFNAASTAFMFEADSCFEQVRWFACPLVS